MSVILRMEASGPDPVIDADGYRIRIAPVTKTSFHGALKALAEVGPGAWIRFEGKRDDGGALIATKAEFYSRGSRTWRDSMGPREVRPAEDYLPITKDSRMDADGRIVSLRTKVRYGDSGGLCGWHRVPADLALQERVERVGISLVPAYQRALAPEDPSRISFRFYAVTDADARTALPCNRGLVLVPKNVVERLKNDDQLAAVLADAVAYQMQTQPTSAVAEWAGLAAELAVVPLSVGAAWPTGAGVDGVMQYEARLTMRRRMARIALQLLADASYDPWQAPEAWRLLEPKDPPQDMSSLKYTREGIYQLAILRWQYKSKWKAGDASPAAPATPDIEAQ